MPDHWHLVWTGLTADSDQLNATAFVRKHLKAALGQAQLQDRAHDHVLRDQEHDRDAFVTACHYIRENPVRAKLVETWAKWPFTGAMVCGYPNFNPRDESFWDDFWKIYNRRVDAG